MTTFWDKLRNTLLFTGIKDVGVWQDLLLGVIFFPIAFEILRWFLDYINNQHPLNRLLNKFVKNKPNVLVFLSQLSAVNESGEVNCDQKYVIKFPCPTPNDRSAICYAFRQRIDPVWSEGDGECLAEVYNIFGRYNKISGLKIANSISDWGQWSTPTISIGFSEKTLKLKEKCEPVHFDISPNALSLKGSSLILNSNYPDDTGIIQKTFIKDNKTPILILAGLGTLGTSVAGYFFSKACLDLGKLYGDESFCALISVKINEGRDSVVLRGLQPYPVWVNMLRHPFTYLKYRSYFSAPNNLK